jgi:hypothetical protein
LFGHNHGGFADPVSGREAVRDPRLVFDMRMGRRPRSGLRSKINRYLAEVAQ